MLNKIIENLEKLDMVKFNKDYRDKAISDATQMLSNGWDALEDGVVVSYKGNQVAVKKGDTVVINMMRDFNINMGKLDGNIDREIKVMEIPEAKRESYLAQAILAKYYTLRGM